MSQREKKPEDSDFEVPVVEVRLPAPEVDSEGLELPVPDHIGYPRAEIAEASGIELPAPDEASPGDLSHQLHSMRGAENSAAWNSARCRIKEIITGKTKQQILDELLKGYAGKQFNAKQLEDDFMFLTSGLFELS